MGTPRDKDVERERLQAENADFRRRMEGLARRNEELARRVAELERLVRELGGAARTERLDQAYSMKAEEQRQGKTAGSKRRTKQKSSRRGRVITQEKLDRADRTEIVRPEGFTVEECRLLSRRPVWRIENGRAVLVAYEFYRGPQGQRGTVPGLLRRCEFGLEILITLAHQSLVIGVSLDKAVEQLRFFWELNLSKSQADALLSRLAREWHVEFDRLCQLIAVSAVVHTDETSWSIGSVWTFLSEQSRLMIFGCRKDAATLEILLPKETFGGVLVSDDAAVYRGFTQAQKCWAHLLRKAIKLTLLRPQNTRYRAFCDDLLAVYRSACAAAADRRLGDAGRQRRIDELEEQLRGLCWEHRPSDHRPPADAVERDSINLALEIVRLMSVNELFTFVKVPGVSGTNNESERTLRDPAQDRRTDQTSRSVSGARRRTILASVLESLRTRLPQIDLRSVLNEVAAWATSGLSCFGQALKALGLAPLEQSPLDQLVPLPTSTTNSS
jgi:transposase